MKLKSTVSSFALILSLSWIIGSVFYYGTYNKLLKDGGDAWGYYIYLPSTFISGDLASLEYIAEKRRNFNPGSIDYNRNTLGFDEVNIAPNGNPVIKYTSGVAILLSPFFLIAHILASLLEFENDGFNAVYWLSAYFGVIFWVLFGSFLLYKVLISHVSKKAAFVTLLLILLGSNLYYFMVYNSPMSHAPLFSLYCILIFLSDKFYKNPKIPLAILIGLVAGLITMIRPVAIICLLIPILWNFNHIKSRIHFLLQHRKLLLMAALGFLIGIFPQLLYWKISSGEWIFYSYGNEGFDFKNPRILKGLTGFKNGWLVYTPLMSLCIPGLWLMFKKQKGTVALILLFMFIHVFIVYSWHNWYYINSFGSRPMVETYGLLAFPLAYFIQWMWQSWRKWILLFLGVFFILLNQFQTWQVSEGIMLSEEGSRDYYLAIFGKTSMTEKMLIAADTEELQPNISNLDSIGILWEYQISQDEMLISNKTENNPGIYFSEIPIQAGDYIRISAIAKSNGWNNNRWGMANTVLYFERNAKKYNWRSNRINNKLGNSTWNLWGGVPYEWGEVWSFHKVPSKYSPQDSLRVFIQNDGPSDIIIQSFKVEHWREK